MFWLGIDTGTGGTRALLVDENGRLKAGFTAPHEDMRMERPMWAEQDPLDWWRAAQEAIRGVLQEAGVTPYSLLETFKAHPAIAPLIEGSEVKEYG